MSDDKIKQTQIIAAKASGWKVMDLNDNGTGIQVRGPNWVLINPIGEITHYDWTEAAAWQAFILVPQPPFAIDLIMSERRRQDEKWGEQNHDAERWNLILLEELGEVAKSRLENDYQNYLTELIQAAAVMVAWIECELRNKNA